MSSLISRINSGRSNKTLQIDPRRLGPVAALSLILGKDRFMSGASDQSANGINGSGPAVNTQGHLPYRAHHLAWRLSSKSRQARRMVCKSFRPERKAWMLASQSFYSPA